MPPSDGAPSAFVAQPIFNQTGEVDLIVALQLSFNDINEIMGVKTGMGETGSTYLVGRDADGKISFRSDMTSAKPEYVVGYNITTPYIEKAMEKPDALGHEVFTDSLGNRVIVAYSSIEVFGKPWAMIGKIDDDEALATAHAIKKTGENATSQMISRSIGVAAVVAVLVIGIGVFIATRLTKPINNMVAMIKDIAEGEGDLTKRLDDSAHDELGETAKWFNTFVEKLRGIIVNIASNSSTVAGAATELSSTASDMAHSSDTLSNQSSTVASAAKRCRRI